jgi:hypothetical protein
MNPAYPGEPCGLPLVATFIENRPRAFWEGSVSAKVAITNTLEATLQAQRRQRSA